MTTTPHYAARSFLKAVRVSWRWLAGQDLIVLLAMLLIATGVLGFLKLADAVSDGETLRFDEAILRALRDPDNPSRPIGAWWTEEVGRDLTALGGVVVLSLLTLITIGFLVMAGKRYAAVFLFVATVGGTLLSGPFHK
jgi:undecaprenyl-diphosphatase